MARGVSRLEAADCVWPAAQHYQPLELLLMKISSQDTLEEVVGEFEDSVEQEAMGGPTPLTRPRTRRFSGLWRTTY